MFNTREELIETLERAERFGYDSIKNMPDGYPCGGAYITTDGNNFLVKAIKKFAEKDGDHYRLGNWSMRKGYPKGFTISFHRPEGPFFQNMNMASTKYQKAVESLSISGLNVHTYID